MTHNHEEAQNQQAQHVAGFPVPPAWPGASAGGTPGPQAAPHAHGLISAADVLAVAPEPLRWTVAMLAYRGGLTIMAAPGESGKSTLALHTAASVAAGETIGGLACAAGSALYVDAEGRKPTMHRRLAKMMTRVTPDLHMYFPTRRDPLNIAEDSGLARLEAAIGYVGATHVVLDSLTRLTGGIEDTTVEMGRAVGGLADLASELDVAVLVVHHSNRGGTRRGHSSVRDQADMLYVTAPRSTPQAMVLVADKFRERAGLPYHELRVGIGTVDENKTTIHGPGVVFPKGDTPMESPALAVVLDWIADEDLGEVDRRGIAGALSEAWDRTVAVSHTSVRNVYRELVARGWSERTVDRRKVLSRTEQ